MNFSLRAGVAGGTHSGMGATARRAAVTVALAAVAVPMLPDSTGAAVRDCRAHRPGLYDVSARNMSCKRALRLIDTARYDNNGPDEGAHVRGWRCVQISEYSEGGTFRCSRGRKAFRWTAGG